MPATGTLLDAYGRPLLCERTQTAIANRRRLSEQIGKRLHARYDAAQTDRHNQNHWAGADGLSADAAANPGVRRTLRNRARYECANNSYASGMVRTLANDTVGTGPTLNLNSGDDDADTDVEMLFWRWMQATRFAEKLRTMRMARTRDGEGFATFVTNPRLTTPVRLDLRLYEAEQVCSPWTGNNALDTDGIILDDFGNVAGYSLMKTHPGGSMIAMGEDFATIPARDMLHVFHAERAGQHRGVPEITPALPLYAQLRRFTLAVIAAAETAADFAAFIQSQASAEDPDDVDPLDVIDIEARMMMTLPKGWMVSQLKAEQPTTTYEMFKRAILQEIARCLSMPYNVAAGDSSSYNYASGRLDHKTYFKSIRVDRSEFEGIILDPTFARWWEEARLIPGYLPASIGRLPEPPNHEWRWDGDEHVDPLKEANAQQKRLESNTTTLAREYSAQGLDWEEQLRQRAKELRLMKELGITLAEAKPAAEEEDDDDDK